MTGTVEKESLPALSRRAAAGDREAFRAWLEQTHAMVFSVAYRMLQDRADAEDVVQQTYIQAWRSMGNLKDHQASVAWVGAIARHVAADRWRQRARRPMESLDDTPHGGPTPLVESLPSPDASAEERVADAQVRQRLMQAVGMLKEKFRMVLMMRDVDGMTNEAVAAALGIPVGTVDSRLHRARLMLARKMKAMSPRTVIRRAS